MTTGTETTLVAGEGDEHFVTAAGAADSGKPEVQVAATQVLANHLADDRPPEAVAVLIAVVVGSFELREVALDEPVERRLPRPAGTVDRDGVGADRNHGAVAFPGSEAGREKISCGG